MSNFLVYVLQYEVGYGRNFREDGWMFSLLWHSSFIKAASDSQYPILKHGVKFVDLALFLDWSMFTDFFRVVLLLTILY